MKKRTTPQDISGFASKNLDLNGNDTSFETLRTKARADREKSIQAFMKSNRQPKKNQRTGAMGEAADRLDSKSIQCNNNATPKRNKLGLTPMDARFGLNSAVAGI